ncbi:unnamed protein product [Dovyalis caffra]|uniref:Uncharacterized protein n=1 Tax=Dovyalis caffra TaxID=77055 RepID=A0AAV1SHA8_9ROSI|nr:unnamed protein product [Dovyalis caffra]
MAALHYEGDQLTGGGAWSPEEDPSNRHGIWNWIEMPEASGKKQASEDSEGLPKLPTANFSSSFNLVNDLTINENQTIEDKVGLPELTGEQCLWGQPFSTERQKCKVEDYGDTCTVEMWVQGLLHGDTCTEL